MMKLIDKYYDYKLDKPIDIQNDGCNFNNWKEMGTDYPFALHNDGFKIFVNYASLSIDDEYSDIDPYTVTENSNFHNRRLKGTIEMITMALNKINKENVKLLDIGCGMGYFTDIISNTFSNIDVTACDYSISAIKYANAHFPKIDFSVADIHELPYTEKYFDIIVLNNIFEHIPDIVSCLQKISKLLVNKNGYIIISTPSRYRMDNLIRILRHKKIQLISEYHVTEYSTGQVEEMLSYAGFDMLKIWSEPLKKTLSLTIFTKIVSIFRNPILLESTVFYLASNTKEELYEKK